jgi:hypothetical protein
MIDSRLYKATSMAASGKVGEVPPSTEAVVAAIPQGFDARIKVRFVHARDIGVMTLDPGCSPRQGVPGPATVLLPGLVAKLQKADQQVITWLAKDSANAKRFLEQPVAALREAGIELDRSELKALERAHAAVREASVVPPGVTLERLDASAHRTARVGDKVPGKKSEPPRSDRGCRP